MSQNTRKARPTAATVKRATEPGTNNHESPKLYSDFITAKVGRQTKISGLLLQGQENAIPLRHLVHVTGLPGRDLRRRIQEERLSGVPILSDNASGYYLPADDSERRQFIRSMRGRAKEIEAVAAAVERYGADWT